VKVNHLEILKRSFILAFKNKWLILLAIFLTSITALSLNFGNSSQGNSNRLNNINQNLNLNLNQQNYNFQQVRRSFDNFISTVSIDSKLGLIFLFLLIISFSVLATIIKVYATNFAIGNLFYGIKEVDENRDISLTSISQLSREKVIILFLTYLISWLVYLLPFLISVILFFYSLSFLNFSLFGSTRVQDEFYIYFPASILLFLIVYLSYSFTSINLEYLILLKNMKPFDAFKISFVNSIKNFVDNSIFETINCLGGCLFGTIVLTVTGVLSVILVLLVGGSISAINQAPWLFALSSPIIIFLALGILALATIASSIISLIFTIYKYLFNSELFKEHNDGK